MSDVLDEIISRLTQKAKNLTQIEYELNRMYDKTRTIERLEEVDREFRKIKWVRLEDAKKAIQQLRQNYEIEAIKCLIEILDNAKDIEGKAEEIKQFNDDLHAFLEFRATKISDNITKLRKVLGLKPLSEYNLEELLRK